MSGLVLKVQVRVYFLSDEDPLPEVLSPDFQCSSALLCHLPYYQLTNFSALCVYTHGLAFKRDFLHAEGQCLEF